MATDPSIKIVKSFTYRGAARLWSNRYHFDNLAPDDSTKWTTFSDAVVAAEKAIYSAGYGTIVHAYGYDAGSDVPIFDKAYTQAGTGSFSAGALLPGDACALARWSTAQKSTKNHPIYLYSYWHSVFSQNYTNGDTISTAQITAMSTYAAAWVTGFSDGAVTHHRCGPNGHVATGALVTNVTRHRDFPPA